MVEAAQRLGPDGVLIAAGAGAGLDTPTVWALIVVPKIPFSAPTVLKANTSIVATLRSGGCIR